jgi:hypothetical protein
MAASSHDQREFCVRGSSVGSGLAVGSGRRVLRGVAAGDAPGSGADVAAAPGAGAWVDATGGAGVGRSVGFAAIPPAGVVVGLLASVPEAVKPRNTRNADPARMTTTNARPTTAAMPVP